MQSPGFFLASVSGKGIHARLTRMSRDAPTSEPPELHEREAQDNLAGSSDLHFLANTRIAGEMSDPDAVKNNKKR
jgi:hypothetical protein